MAYWCTKFEENDIFGWLKINFLKWCKDKKLDNDKDKYLENYLLMDFFKIGM